MNTWEHAHTLFSHIQHIKTDISWQKYTYCHEAPLISCSFSISYVLMVHTWRTSTHAVIHRLVEAAPDEIQIKLPLFSFCFLPSWLLILLFIPFSFPFPVLFHLVNILAFSFLIDFLLNDFSAHFISLFVFPLPSVLSGFLATRVISYMQTYTAAAEPIGNMGLCILYMCQSMYASLFEVQFEVQVNDCFFQDF